jgi:tetratricopeptide (TPR) repeat protein
LGPGRRGWLEEALAELAQSGVRTFCISCDFESGGPWAGVSELFAILLPEIQTQRPDLIERHAFELAYILPRLRKTLPVRNPNLTDLAPAEERTRNYPADRAFRIAHGLIDLLDSWKTETGTEIPWAIACDSYDSAGAMGAFFFRELLRRRAAKLQVRLLVMVDEGNGEKTSDSLLDGSSVQVIHLLLPRDNPAPVDALVAARLASELEQRIGSDPIEKQVHLGELIRLWQLAGRPDKLLRWKYFGLETYNTLGLYADALRYGEGLLSLMAEHAPEEGQMRWFALLKLLMCHIGLGDVQTSLRLATEEGLKLAENHPRRRAQLFYLMAMFYARFQKPRDFAKGEEYLELSLKAIAEADFTEAERHFQVVFNRNGLAMIRNFQGRFQEAIDLCRAGSARLDEHLSAEEHRLHRSILTYNTGQVYAAVGSYEPAIKHFSQAIAMDPNYSEYYNDRGSVYLRLGLVEEARADYARAIELSPPYFEVFTNLGQCYRRIGAMTKAIEAYSRALDLEPTQILAILGRAKSHEELGHVAEAIADYTSALALDSNLWEAVASRGVMHYEAGDLASALADFDRALELKPDQPDLYENRATVLAGLGRQLEAAVDRETASRVQGAAQIVAVQ